MEFMSKKYHIFKRPNKNIRVNVEEKILPNNSSNLLGPQVPKYIVIHEVSLGTGKSPSEFNMEHYYKKIYDAGQSGSTIGYHYLVGDNSIYHFIPDNIATGHTGTDFGNHKSIGVERLICKGINYEYAIHNQAKLIATLMLKHNIPLSNVITHKEMQLRYGSEERRNNPKQCPGRLIAGFRGTLNDFRTEIKRCFMHGWFFNELLDEKTINKIPDVMAWAQRKYMEEINMKKQGRMRNINKDDIER